MRLSEYYDRHPISEAEILAALRRRRGGETGALTPDDLFEFDQDHYGGLAAVDTLARRAGITASSRVLDLGAGLGGPARFLAARRGCRVVALELHAARAAGAQRLTRFVGLAALVHVVRGDACALPLRPRSFDACLSQEGLLHVVDKAGVLAGCHRLLRTGGRLAFTDWIVRGDLGDGERARLWDWMAATTVQTRESYRALLGRAGFSAIEAEDISDEWRPVLRRRLETYGAMRAATAARFGEAWARDFLELFAFFVRLVEAGKLGGGRFTGTA
jgi:SAM-dependent methyltransferase